MGAKKKKGSRKKRHISKHVLKSREGGSSGGDDDGVVNSETTTARGHTNNNQNNSNQNKHVKDPREAAAYLTNWENRKNRPEAWKFNKNTQAWIFRHAYDVEKVPKAIFKILVSGYLNGLQGDLMRKRIKEDASRRARRYKDHVSSGSGNTDGGDVDESRPQVEEGQTSPKDDDDDKDDKKKIPSNAEPLGDESRWRGLSENDKRKEYKRARMILDALKG